MSEPPPASADPPASSSESAQAQAAAVPTEVERLRAELLATQSRLADLSDEYTQLQDTLRELGTPVLPVHDGVLVLPLIGHLDGNRGAHLMEDLLAAIAQHQAEVVLIDITGVSVVDTAVANTLIQATRAASLLGATCILVGISAAVSRTIVQLGIELGQVHTRRDLQAGIALALKQRGYSIARTRADVDWLSEFDK